MIRYRTAAVGDHQIFYREAGDPNPPSLLLLHGGHPHMFRNLIPLVSDRFHIVAASALSSRTSRRVLGETGLWNLGCDCFAF